MWYERMFENRDMMESLQTTIVIALIATLVSTLLGTISAIGLSRCRKVLRKAVLQLNDFPIMNPEIVTAIGLMLLFITFHIERGFVTMLWHTSRSAPRMSSSASCRRSDRWIPIWQTQRWIWGRRRGSAHEGARAADHAGHRLRRADRVHDVL